MTRQQIIIEIEKWRKYDYPRYYIGITDDIDSRLYGDQNVDKENDVWIYCEADNVTIARDVEQHFLDLGMKGGPGGGNDKSVFVYCYLIQRHTKE